MDYWGGGGGGAKGMLAPLPNYWGGGLAPPAPPLPTPMIIARTPFVMYKGTFRVERIFINNAFSFDFRAQNIPLVFPY